MRDWRKSRLAAGVVIAGLLIVQVSVPISRISSGDTARFGWQMYSTARPIPDFSVETSAGTVEIDLDDYLAWLRVEIDVRDLLPEHLCSVVDGAVVVSWENGEHPC